jgi:hypothetical protein
MPDLQSELAALAQEESRATDRALAAAEDARRVLRQDLPEFVAREIRRCFLASPAFADSLSDDAVSKIKADVQDTAKTVTETALAALASDDPWLAGVEHLKSNDQANSFEDNPSVWAAVQGVAAAATALLERHAFPVPEGGWDVRYKQPAFFVGGRHMKSVAEHYWRALREVRDLRRRSEELAATARSDELGRRWDSA